MQVVHRNGRITTDTPASWSEDQSDSGMKESLS